jgi:hypothetical protein
MDRNVEFVKINPIKYNVFAKVEEGGYIDKKRIGCIYFEEYNNEWNEKYSHKGYKCISDQESNEKKLNYCGFIKDDKVVNGIIKSGDSMIRKIIIDDITVIFYVTMKIIE